MYIRKFLQDYENRLSSLCVGKSIVVFFLRLINWMVESVPLTTKVVSSNSIHGEAFSIYYMTKFASGL